MWIALSLKDYGSERTFTVIDKVIACQCLGERVRLLLRSRRTDRVLTAAERDASSGDGGCGCASNHPGIIQKATGAGRRYRTLRLLNGAAILVSRFLLRRMHDRSIRLSRFLDALPVAGPGVQVHIAFQRRYSNLSIAIHDVVLSPIVGVHRRDREAPNAHA